MAKTGFIGMGNMGTALLLGALKTFPREDMIFCAKTQETKRRIYAIMFCHDNRKVKTNAGRL